MKWEGARNSSGPYYPLGPKEITPRACRHGAVLVFLDSIACLDVGLLDFGLDFEFCQDPPCSALLGAWELLSFDRTIKVEVNANQVSLSLFLRK